jgi:nitroreductase
MGKEIRMAGFLELLKKRRSIRDFQEKEVPLSLVQEIIKDSCLAPSANNGQPWGFIVVNRRDWIKRLSDESKRNLLSDLEKNPGSPIKRYEPLLRDGNFNVFYNSPCVVYIAGPKAIPTLPVDCTLAACYFMLSAAARDLGTCWIGLGAHIRDPGILKEMGLPEDWRIIAPIIVGYPKTIPDPRDRTEPRLIKVIS